MEQNIDEDLVTEQEAALLLRRHQKTLYKWRQEGLAPRHIKLPKGGVLYRASDLRRYLADNSTTSLVWG
jgi:predicted DNA-binding transcriptional regulator AlpA